MRMEEASASYINKEQLTSHAKGANCFTGKLTKRFEFAMKRYILRLQITNWIFKSDDEYKKDALKSDAVIPIQVDQANESVVCVIFMHLSGEQ